MHYPFTHDNGAVAAGVGGGNAVGAIRAARYAGGLLISLHSHHGVFLNKFNYELPAELFPVRNRKVGTKIKYRRFDRAADAIRFAIEELPAPILLGAFIEVEDDRLGHRDILDLYNSADYPLPRSQVVA